MHRRHGSPAPGSRDARARWLAAAAWFACACADGGAGPRLAELARGFRPVPVSELAGRWDAGEPGGAGDPLRHRVMIESYGLRIQHDFERADWNPDPERQGIWWARLPAGTCRRADGSTARLKVAGSEWVRARSPDTLRERGFLVQADRVLLRPPGTEPPDPATLDLRVENGWEVDGVWKVRIGSFFGAGIPVWSGESESVEVELPAGSCIAFAARHSTASAGAPATFRVEGNGALLWEGSLTRESDGTWQSIALPAAAGRKVRLGFRVEGPPGLGVFYGPVVRPLEVGRYGARPWPEERPDVVLFLADTFRADSLAEYGGPAGLTPNLDRLAADSVRFLRARSCASWTLPSISSVLTGLNPLQHGVNHPASRMPEAVDTLAEHFARAGYRTGAVTDAVFFTGTYGLEQGFEWFHQRESHSWSLDRSIDEARSFLAGDDGRPVFLVVHTFRTHGPFRTGREESKAAWSALIGDARVEFDVPDHPTRDVRQRVFLAMRDPLRELYREGVRGLDASLGDFRALLEERGVLDHGYLVVTADHGEAFGENGVMFHGGDLWDSRLCVPLLIKGHDLAPRAVPWTVSNVDVAPTLAQLAGLAPLEGWAGGSLLEVESDRTVFAFQLEGSTPAQLAILEGDRKVLAPGIAELEEARGMQAYDLAGDRLEEHDLAASAGWASELARRNAARLRRWQETGLRGGRADLDAKELETLEDLGYGGGR